MLNDMKVFQSDVCQLVNECITLMCDPPISNFPTGRSVPSRDPDSGLGRDLLCSGLNGIVPLLQSLYSSTRGIIFGAEKCLKEFRTTCLI